MSERGGDQIFLDLWKVATPTLAYFVALVMTDTLALVGLRVTDIELPVEKGATCPSEID